ncbi:MAG: FAD-dependent oxidoreductase [Clostridiales bacterium]|jgi:NADPH-dependent 2,4-dienoyl-CoA reductase/sulfur reductase-like enzyme/peroxiredoxin family protein/TusA-related sulfurtransferase/rhodanese-related sulfurtransferase|nr:FAD-dependent oxidoreductase [Clostridiales bacterium]MCI2160602.1 FAD-dependent oxidoreductase [Oscillospiraceae bacterium]MCI1960987.1 FAD-dependent oxidoreductase [Clostridiales bacterium]MCI2021428.1 FAD-dependent oxidoreductase [Clostridiales bacterium]MCI2026214.1 FAD-dependent oxidoreductase [Clostridiales bacterium]
MKKVVIIGGVAGGASCAARLRRLDESAEIVVLERGEYISYANCGLPYYVGDVIKSRNALLLQTPKAMKEKFRVDVRVKNEVIKIDREKKVVQVRRLEDGKIYEEPYDTLVISTGSSPVRPRIPGIDSPRIQTLWTVPDTDRIRKMIHEQGAHSAAVIGGGFIGLEMAENLSHAGLEVSVIEAADQVMAPLDYEMAQLLHENLRENCVNLYLGDGVSAFHEEKDAVKISLNSGKSVTADMVLLSIGVRPNGELAKEAGLAVNARGGIVVDKMLHTSDPDIFAVGDVIEVEDFISKDRTMIPLAGPANKQGRIAANNIAGAHEEYNGTMGTSVAKVFDLTAACTGANEKALTKQGKVKGKDYESILITQNSHAGYYPGAVPMTLKLIFSMDGAHILGAQIVGRNGVDKRIDTIAVAIRMGAGVGDLKQLELAYAPPYSSAKDPVNMAGFVAENVLSGVVSFTPWNIEKTNPDALLLDVREDAELLAFSLPQAMHIPLGQLRNRLDELDHSREIITFCAIGVRSYNAARILMQNGFSNVKVYPGGTRFYQSTHPQENSPAICCRPNLSEHMEEKAPSQTDISLRIDCSGMQCPGPIMKVYESMQKMRDGEVMEVSASDPGFVRDINAWCRRTGNELLSKEQRGSEYVARVMKKSSKPAGMTSAKEPPEGKTLIVFSGDLDKVLASFIIANGAAAMGRPVTMFFTFWGLTALRKEKKQSVSKTMMESLFGTMLPRGSKRLKLSKMNMGGLGTAMMKKIMNDKNVDSLEALIQKAMKAGVKIVACSMSMEIMGIRKEELIDGVEIGGVGTYLGDAEESNVNLFI